MLRLRGYILIIVFIGLLLYSKGLLNDFVGDDDLQILRNIKVHSFSNLPLFFSGSTYENAGADETAGIFYRPLMMASFSIIYSLFGPNPIPFHLLQLLFYIANTILVFLLLRRFLDERSSFVLSLIFLVHPVNAETVLYSANLQEVLFFFFGIISLLIISQRNYKYRHIAFASLMILGSLFSKESGILFIAITILYSFLFIKNKSYFKSFSISMSVTFAVYLFFRYVVAHMQSANTSIAPIANASFYERIINIPAVILYYLRIFFYPKTMGTNQFWIVKSISLWDFWIPLFIAASFLTLIILGYIWTAKKHKANKNIYLFFMLWFFIGLSLHLQLLPLDVTVADRWFYFPLLGILALIGISFKQFNLMRIKHAQAIWGSTITLLLFILFIRTFIRISDLRDNLKLYEHDVKSQSNFILENAYGTALIKDDQFEKAKKYIEKSVKEHPYSANLNNLAIVYAAKHDKTNAKKYFEEAIEKGKNFSVYENYANFLLYYENPNDALEFSKLAVRTFPDSPKLWLVIAQTEYLKGNKKEALTAVAKSYKLQPDKNTLDIFTKISQNKPLTIKRY